ncbi:MAG TPA: MAPEG family protein [Steroidobacteraceae bacterium]
MRTEQKIVAVGVAIGVVAMALSVWALTRILPIPAIADTSAERLVYALRANVVAIIPFVVMVVTVANSRFFSDAIDPTRHVESRSLEIDRRAADNTLQQSFVFTVASLALSTIVPLHYLQVVWACVITFVVARAAFWLGYRINPLYRAPGMSATAYINLGMILFVVFDLLRGA